MQTATYNNPRIKQFYSADPRGVPLYSIYEVARYVKIHDTTLRAWLHGRTVVVGGRKRRLEPVITPASPSRLSFLNLLEAFTLSSLTRIERLSFRSVRRALETLREGFPSEHPWIDHDFLTDHIDLFIEADADFVNLSKGGQIEFREIVKAYMTRIQRDIDLSPVKVFPFSRQLKFDLFKDPLANIQEILGELPQFIEVDPLIAFGRPTITGTGVPVETIASRNRAGDTISFIAKDYGISEEQVQEAIEYEKPRRAA